MSESEEYLLSNTVRYSGNERMRVAQSGSASVGQYS